MSDIKHIVKKLKELEERISKLERASTQKIKITKNSITDLILELKSEGFFKEPRSVKDIIEILASRGRHYPTSSLTWPLQHAVRTRVLGRIKKDKIWAYVDR